MSPIHAKHRIDDKAIHDLVWMRRRLLKWFHDCGRTYPWRNSGNPFHVLIAEVMLRRTRADQVVSAYENFVREFPTAKALANSSPERIEACVHRLGLPKRAHDIMAIGEMLLTRFGGCVPKTRLEMLQLPGVGEYVAGAVLCISFNKREWIVDTNNVRVFRRFFGLNLRKDARRMSAVVSLAKAYSRTTQPKCASLALIDHAALVCTPSAPRCYDCPLMIRCRYWFESADVRKKLINII